MSVRIAFLDRDGTINVDHGYVHHWSDWQFVPGAIEGLRALHGCGYLLAIVSNQSGIARGLYSERDVRELHQQMQDFLKAEGIPIAAVAYCPHGPEDNCSCRKPATGLAAEIQRHLNAGIDFARSWTIGDKISDLEFGKTLGTRTALLISKYWQPAELSVQPDIIAKDLEMAVKCLLP